MRAWFVAVFLAFAAPAHAQAPAEISPLAAWLDGVQTGLARSADAMSRLTDRLLAVTGGPANASALNLDPKAANAASADLTAVYREFIELRLVQTTATAPMLTDFAANPDPAQWARVKARLASTRDAIRRVDSAIAALGPEFTLSPLYPELRANLHSRAAALDGLADAPPPRTPEELAAYRRMVTAYIKLLDEMGRLGEAFRAYASAKSAAADPPR